MSIFAVCIGVAAGILLVLLVLFTLVLTKRDGNFATHQNQNNNLTTTTANDAAGQLTNAITATRCLSPSSADVMTSPSRKRFFNSGGGDQKKKKNKMLAKESIEDAEGEKEFLALQSNNETIVMLPPEKMEMG